jgi:hypothetical protein
MYPPVVFSLPFRTPVIRPLFKLSSLAATVALLYSTQSSVPSLAPRIGLEFCSELDDLPASTAAWLLVFVRPKLQVLRFVVGLVVVLVLREGLLWRPLVSVDDGIDQDREINCDVVDFHFGYSWPLAGMGFLMTSVELLNHPFDDT